MFEIELYFLEKITYLKLDIAYFVVCTVIDHLIPTFNLKSSALISQLIQEYPEVVKQIMAKILHEQIVCNSFEEQLHDDIC